MIFLVPKDDQAPILGAQLDAAEAETYAERVKTIGRELGSGECHDIELHRIDGRIYLSCHVLVNAAVPMAEVHRIAEEIENRLRREFPELGRVVIHTEPVSRE